MLLSKSVFRSITIILFLNLVVIAQNSSNIKEPEFMPDRSDLTQALKVKSFQFQSGFSYSRSENNDITSNQISIPFLILRYGLLNNFTLQLQSEFDLKETLLNEDVVNKNSQIGYILLGVLYQLEQKERIAFFDRLSFLFSNLIPLNSSYEFYSELDFVFETNLSKRFFLEYGVGYRYQKNTDGHFDFLFQITANLTRTINSSVTYTSLFLIGENPSESQNSLGFNVNYIPTFNYQFSFDYSFGLNQNSDAISVTFIYTFI